MKKITTTIILSLTLLLSVSYSSALAIEEYTSEPLAVAVPTAYHDDYTSLPYTTSIKDQGSYGVCWAFSAIACCEADAIKNHGADITLDLSERHLAYFTFDGDRTGGLYGDVISVKSGYDYLDDLGGHDIYAQHILSNHIGLRLESEARYSQLTADREATLSDSIMMGGSYYLDNLYVYPYDVSDLSDIKSAIMTYGAVSVGFYYDGTNAYTNTITSSQYCDIAYPPNHAVTIVGWDDEYSRTNFRYGTRPTGDGAWLVKNSYGSSWGTMEGYFWLSYEDETITECSAYDVVPASRYDNIYQYDGGISMYYLSPASVGGVGHYANVFTASGEEYLKAVGVTLYDVTESVPYTLKVYKNPSSTAPDSGTLLTTVSGSFSMVGYANIPISDEVILESGTRFSIVLTTSAKVGVDATQDMDKVISTASVSIGQSYTSTNGISWTDGASESSPYNVRLKALTTSIVRKTAIVDGAPTATVYYGQSLDKAVVVGSVKDEVSGDTLSGTWKITDTTVPTADGSVTAIFEISDVGYDDVSAVVSYVILPTVPKVDISLDKSIYLVGDVAVVGVEVANPYTYAELSIPYAVYYQIGDGEWLEAVGDTFLIPDSAVDGQSISIKVVTASESGRYEASEETTSIVIGEDNSPTTSGRLDDGVRSIVLVAIIGSVLVSFVIVVLKKS